MAAYRSCAQLQRLIGRKGAKAAGRWGLAHPLAACTPQSHWIPVLRFGIVFALRVVIERRDSMTLLGTAAVLIAVVISTVGLLGLWGRLAELDLWKRGDRQLPRRRPDSVCVRFVGFHLLDLCVHPADGVSVPAIHGLAQACLTRERQERPPAVRASLSCGNRRNLAGYKFGGRTSCRRIRFRCWSWQRRGRTPHPFYQSRPRPRAAWQNLSEFQKVVLTPPLAVHRPSQCTGTVRCPT
jgi:hypothetical protein